MKDTTLIEAQNIDTLLGRELKFLQILAGFTVCLVSLFVNVKDTLPTFVRFESEELNLKFESFC